MYSLYPPRPASSRPPTARRPTSCLYRACLPRAGRHRHTPDFISRIVGPNWKGWRRPVPTLVDSAVSPFGRPARTRGRADAPTRRRADTRGRAPTRADPCRPVPTRADPRGRADLAELRGPRTDRDRSCTPIMSCIFLHS